LQNHFPIDVYLQQLARRPQGPTSGGIQAEQQEELSYEGCLHHLLPGNGRHEAKEGEKYNKITFIHYGFS